jgi:hypothetical protein
MKKLFSILALQFALTISISGQTVSNYICKLDNGIIVRTEQCWGHVWVEQRFEPISGSNQIPLISLNVRNLGELISGSSFKLSSGGKEVSLKAAKPGTYIMTLTFKLSGKTGTLSFDVDNILIKPKSKTTISITLYDYQILIEEIPGSQKGSSAYTSKIDVYKGYAEQNPSYGVPTFYLKGVHDKSIAPVETINSKKGKMKPATYDVMLSLGAPGHLQKIWLENFVMKPDVTYNITANLNAGIIAYSGVGKDFKAIHVYPAGTADRQKGSPAPDKNLEMIRCEGQTATSPCPPGLYDILINFGNGARYEWRKNIVVKTGSRTNIQ